MGKPSQSRQHATRSTALKRLEPGNKPVLTARVPMMISQVQQHQQAAQPQNLQGGQLSRHSATMRHPSACSKQRKLLSRAHKRRLMQLRKLCVPLGMRSNRAIAQTQASKVRPAAAAHPTMQARPVKPSPLRKRHRSMVARAAPMAQALQCTRRPLRPAAAPPMTLRPAPPVCMASPKATPPQPPPRLAYRRLRAAKTARAGGPCRSSSKSRTSRVAHWTNRLQTRLWRCRRR